MEDHVRQVRAAAKQRHGGAFAQLESKMDLWDATVFEVAEILGRLSAARRQEMLRTIGMAIRHGALKEEARRIAAAKVIVALLPDSLGPLRRYLRYHPESMVL